MALDPLVNTNVDAFFDNPIFASSFADPVAGNDAVDAPATGVAFEGVDTSVTEYYNPANQVQAPIVEPTAPEAIDAPVIEMDFASENLALKRQIAELQLYKPLGEMIQRNPDFLQAVETSLKQVPVQPTVPQLVKPIAPVRPANFDVAESFSVPDSESWKFREAKEEFTNAMFDYQDKREAVAVEAQTQANNRYQQQLAHQNMVSELTTRHGYTAEQAVGFIQRMSDPASRSIANLVALDRMNTQQKPGIVAGATKSALKNVPLPLAVAAGGNAAAKAQTDSDSFNAGLMSARRI